MRTIRVILIILVCQSVLTAKLEETVAVHSKGSNIRLTCYRENPQDKLLWTTSKGTILFNDDVRYSKEEQYSNFEVEILEDSSTLIVKNADLDDEGEYVCSDSMGKDMVNVSIEVAPNLEMKVNGIIEPSLMTNISVTCRASGAKPTVSIRIRVGVGGWLMPTVSETSPSGLLWDTIATFYILLPTDTTDTSVICQTFGQVSVEHITVTEYLSSPVCILQESTLEISCNCTSNPPVDKYLFAIGGETNVTGSTEGTLSVANIMGSEVICYGLSTLGIGKSNAIVVPPKEESESSSVFLIIAIVAVIVLVVIVVSLVTRASYNRWKKGGDSDEESTNDNHPQNSGDDTNERQEDNQTENSGENEKLLNEAQTLPSGNGNEELSSDNHPKPSGGDKNERQVDNRRGKLGENEKLLNEAQTLPSEDDLKLPNVNQTQTSGQDVSKPLGDTQTASEVAAENKASYQGKQGDDKHKATKGFTEFGGVKQMTADYNREGKTTPRESEDTAANNNDAEEAETGMPEDSTETAGRYLH